MAIRSIAVTAMRMACLCAGIAFLGQVAPPAQTTHFKRGQAEIRGLWTDGRSGFLAGAKAMYELDGDSLHWKAMQGMLGIENWKMVGGDVDHMFFTSHGAVGGMNPTEHLMRWTRSTGEVKQVAEISQTLACTFFDATHGAYLESAPGPRRGASGRLKITFDGGNTWNTYDTGFDKGGIIGLLWLTPSRLVVSGPKVIEYKVDEKEGLTAEWTADVVAGFAQTDLSAGPGGGIWVKTQQGAAQLSGATGKKLAEIKSNQQIEVIAAVGNDFWMAGEEWAGIYREDGHGAWGLVKEFGYPGERGAMQLANGQTVVVPVAADVNWIIQGRGGSAMLVGVDGQVYTWDGKGDELATTALEINNMEEQKAEQAENDKMPTPEQFKELMPLIDKVPQNRLGDVMAAGKEKQSAEHWTQRQLVAFEIVELKKVMESEAKNPTPPPPTGDFGSMIFGLRLFSATSGVALTQQGMAVMDGSIMKWKGVTGWDRPHSVYLLGGSEKGVYILTADNVMVVVKEGFDPPPGHERDPELHRETRQGKEMLTRYDYTFTLWRWTREGGFAEVRKLPAGETHSMAGVCNFASERVGAFMDGTKLQVTIDSGKTWAETPLMLDPRTRGVKDLAFYGEDKLIVTSGDQSVSMMQLDKDGHATQNWRSKISGGFGNVYLHWPQASSIVSDPAHELVWVFSDKPGGTGSIMMGLSAADGATAKSFSPVGDGESLASFSVSGGRMFCLVMGKSGGTTLRLWNISGEGPAETSQIHVQSNSAALAFACVVPGTDDLFLQFAQRRLIKWDGKPEIPTFLTSATVRPSVDTTVLSDAEDHWPPGEFASRKEALAHTAAVHGMTPDQQMQLSTEENAWARQNTTATPRERTLWLTSRAFQLKGTTTAPDTLPANRN